MANNRAMKTLGQATQLVFATGERIEYPRYRISSNGFVRGPRNEQVGRGNSAIDTAAQACSDQIQAWLDRMSRFGKDFQGVAWPTELMHNYDWELRRAKEFSEDKIWTGSAIVIKAYWRNEPDCFDVFKVTWTPSHFNNQAGLTLSAMMMPLRNIPLEDAPKAIDENGTIDQKYVPLNEPVVFNRERVLNIRRAAEVLRDWSDELHSMLTQKYESYVSSQPLNELRDSVTRFLEGSKYSAELVDPLKQVADLFTKMGYSVKNASVEGNINFTVRDGEHSVRFGNNSLEVTCHFEADEARLTQLQRMRLEAEYHESLKVHGDLTDYDPTEEDDDEQDIPG